MPYTAKSATVALVRRLRAFKLARPRRRVAKPLQPNTVRLEYFKAIRSRFLDPARDAVMAGLLPELDAILAERGDADNMDAGGKRVNASMDKITKGFWDATFHPREAEALAELAADRTSKFHKRQFDRQVRSGLGVDVFVREPDLSKIAEDFVAENVALIKTIPNQYFDDIEKIVTAGVRQGKRHEEIARDIQARYDVAENRAKLIARDQVGKFYGDLAKARQEDMGVTKYIWRTVNDNRVRSEHHARDGKTFSWARPPADGHPGHPINCRCYAEPDFSDILDEV